jgi:hypothetical protein
MYIKEQIRELRDMMLKEQNSSLYLGSIFGKTAQHILDNIMYESDSAKIENSMKTYATIKLSYEPHSNDETNYKLAYDLLFGDISVAPLHINDALETVAKWRLRQF